MDTKKLRQKILDLAIHGKLVPQDPNDEPASVLLERIRAEKERLVKEGKIKKSKSSRTTDTSHYEHVPFEVPSSWEWCNLEDICVFLSRGKSPKYSENDRTYPVFAQKCNLKDGGISLEQARFLDPSTVSKWDDIYKLQTGDVLVNSTGTGTVGRTRLFDVTCLGSYPFVVPDSHVSVIRTSNQINSKFIFAYISSKFIQQYLEDNLAGSTNQKELYIGVLSTLRIPIPSFTEQERIVVEIEKWFALIDQIEQEKGDLQATIKQARSKILDLAIHGKLVPQDPNDEAASELIQRINPAAEIACDNGQYGKLPKGWCLCKLGDIGEIVTGSTPTKDISEYYGGIIPFYKPADLENGICVKDASDHLSILGYEQARKIPAYSILVTCIGATIGKTGLIIAEGSCNQQINAIIPNETTYAKFLYYTCISDYMQKEIKLNASATTLPILNKGNFAKLLFPLPPLTEQHRIVAKIEDLFSSLDNIRKSLEA